MYYLCGKKLKFHNFNSIHHIMCNVHLIRHGGYSLLCLDFCMFLSISIQSTEAGVSDTSAICSVSLKSKWQKYHSAQPPPALASMTLGLGIDVLHHPSHPCRPHFSWSSGDLTIVSCVILCTMTPWSGRWMTNCSPSTSTTCLASCHLGHLCNLHLASLRMSLSFSSISQPSMHF